MGGCVFADVGAVSYSAAADQTYIRKEQSCWDLRVNRNPEPESEYEYWVVLALQIVESLEHM